jgi:hypothetical protein
MIYSNSESCCHQWKIGAQGGFVRHPFKRVNASEVCERLARDAGVVTLPAEFFWMVTGGDDEDTAVNSVSPGDDGMWLRFSVANGGYANV